MRSLLETIFPSSVNNRSHNERGGCTGGDEEEQEQHERDARKIVGDVELLESQLVVDHVGHEHHGSAIGPSPEPTAMANETRVVLDTMRTPTGDAECCERDDDQDADAPRDENALADVLELDAPCSHDEHHEVEKLVEARGNQSRRSGDNGQEHQELLGLPVRGEEDYL